jgi:aspartate aminotransferase-like enzyme
MGTMGDLTAADVLRALEALATVLRGQGFHIAPETGVHAARAVLEEHLAPMH